MAVGKRLWGIFKESGETFAGNGVEFLRQWEEWVWRWERNFTFVDRIPLLLCLLGIKEVILCFQADKVDLLFP
jgi:hypothetical protein